MNMCLMEKLCDGRKTDCEFCLLKGCNCCGTSKDDIEGCFFSIRLFRACNKINEK